MRHGRIVDGQNLNHLLVRTYSPVDHAFQITEITDSETLFRFQREHRNSYTRSLPCRNIKISVSVGNHERFVRLYFRVCQVAVGIIFPTVHFLFQLVVKNEFIFQRIFEFACIQFHLPFREVGVTHQNGLFRIPVA